MLENYLSNNILKPAMPLIIVLLSSLFSCAGLRNKMTFFPDKESELSVREIPNHVSEKRIQTPDGKTLQSFLFSHQGSSKSPLIIYFHGNAGNLYHRFDYANKLYNMNNDVLLVSYRGYAKSTGKPNEKGIYIDGDAAVNFAIDSLGYKEREITIFGRSLGTTVAINTGQNRNFRSIILVTPLTSGKDMAVSMGLGAFKFIAGDSFNSIDKINNLMSSILIIHGDQDELIPFYMGEKLFSSYMGNKKMVTIKGGGHNDLEDIDPKLFWGEIEEFLKKADSR